MFQVCKNEISLRKWSGGAAQLRTLGEHWYCCMQMQNMRFVGSNVSFHIV